MRYLKVFLFVFCIQLSVYGTPTFRYLEQHSIEEISETVDESVKQNIPFLIEIAKRETEDTFFGYHGMSQKSRLFQDILHAVFEEVLHIDIPNHFFFLRIPGEENWNWENGKISFLNRFRQQVLPESYRTLLIKNLFLKIENASGIVLKPEDLSSEDCAGIWSYFQDYIDFSIQKDWSKYANKYSIPEDYVWNDGVFNHKLSRLIEIVQNTIKNKYPETDCKPLRTWLENTFSEEYEVGKLFLLSELNLETSYAKYIDKFFYPFYDVEKPQQLMLVSMNLSIFGNHTDSGSFTAGIYVENESVLGGDKNLESALKEFFVALGLDPDLVPCMWMEGQKILEETGNLSGCLLQFFDESALQGKKPFHWVDQNLYVSFRHGVPLHDLVPSKYICGEYALKKKSKDLELRLVVNNKTVLNPYSSMRIIRYDRLNPQDSEKILLNMKAKLKGQKRDEEKIQKYLEFLQRIWKVSQIIPVNV